MERVGVTGLVRIDMPGGAVIRLSDGAEIRWGADVFVPSDAVYGTIGEIEPPEEGVGVEVPALPLVLLPPSTASAADLVQPGNQSAVVQAWIAEYDVASATVSGTPDRLFYGFLDTGTLVRGPGKLELQTMVVAWTERLMELNIGNSLNPTFHKSVWPGEGGEDHATGLGLPDAWGVEAPPSQFALPVGGGGSAGSVFTGAGVWAGRLV